MLEGRKYCSQLKPIAQLILGILKKYLMSQNLNIPMMNKLKKISKWFQKRRMYRIVLKICLLILKAMKSNTFLT